MATSVREALLALERLDLAADALRARRETLPEIAALAANAAARKQLVSQRQEALAGHAGLSTEDRRLETEASDFGARAKQVEDELYSGRVTASRELETLQTEMQGFQAKRGAIEEQQLLLMERLEERDGEIAGIDARGEALETEAARLAAARAGAEAEIDAELARLARERAETEPELPAALGAAYARVRGIATLRGQVTAELDDGSCSRCRTKLPIMDVTRVRREPADVAVHCPRCQRILLR